MNVQSTKTNVLITVIIAIICFLILIKSGLLDDAGMASIIVMWLPFVVGIITLVFYFIARYFSTKYAWIVTLLGVLLNGWYVFGPMIVESSKK